MLSPAIKREVGGLSATVVVTVASVFMMYARNQDFFIAMTSSINTWVSSRHYITMVTGLMLLAVSTNRGSCRW